jgi:hypothetical protein
LRRVPRSEAYWRQAGVELLFGRNVSLFARGVRISLSGVDDPMELRPAKVIERLSEMIEQVADTLDADSTFRILLSHRPEAFLTKGMARFDLVLSGHTHGGQMAAFGRSFLDLVTGRDIHWGRYTKTLLRDGVARQAALYTTSGFGDWFAFRLACPRELPLIILRRA